jgi:hypothetical protein
MTTISFLNPLVLKASVGNSTNAAPTSQPSQRQGIQVATKIASNNIRSIKPILTQQQRNGLQAYRDNPADYNSPIKNPNYTEIANQKLAAAGYPILANNLYVLRHANGTDRPLIGAVLTQAIAIGHFTPKEAAQQLKAIFPNGVRDQRVSTSGVSQFIDFLNKRLDEFAQYD